MRGNCVRCDLISTLPEPAIGVGVGQIKGEVWVCGEVCERLVSLSCVCVCVCVCRLLHMHV